MSAGLVKSYIGDVLAALDIGSYLLGTIIGFVKTVLLVNAQELVARTDLLNSSMEALLSAALGLGVTIPVLVMYGVLRVRMERIVVELEAAASQITGYFAAAREAKK